MTIYLIFIIIILTLINIYQFINNYTNTKDNISTKDNILTIDITNLHQTTFNDIFDFCVLQRVLIVIKME